MLPSIILEGMDGVGKSTLAKALSSIYNIPLNTIGGPPSTDKMAEEMSQSQIMMASKERYVFDRVTSISRVCYEKKLDTTHHYRMLRDAITISGMCHIIWCITDEPKPKQKDYKSLEHIERVKENHDMIYSRYFWIMKDWVHNVVIYNYTDTSVSELVKELARINSDV